MTTFMYHKIQAILIIFMLVQLEGQQVQQKLPFNTRVRSKSKGPVCSSRGKVTPVPIGVHALWPALHLLRSQDDSVFAADARDAEAGAASTAAFSGKRIRMWTACRAVSPMPYTPQAAQVSRAAMRNLGSLVACAGGHAPSASDPGSKYGTEKLEVQARLFLIYFALQSGMNFYIKWLLAKVQIAQGLLGVPASFLVTSSQQLMCFILIKAFILLSHMLGKPYTPKRLNGPKEVLLVLLLSVAFALNVGLNLYSQTLIPLSTTLTLRACAPVTAAITQTVLLKKQHHMSGKEFLSLIFGVVCACAVVIAQRGSPSAEASRIFFLGVLASVSSLFCGALDFVFKSILGTNVQLSPVDTLYHMSLPVAILTACIGSNLMKRVPTTWAKAVAPEMTDLQVFQTIWQLSPQTFVAIASSGLLAFVYIVFQTFLVVKLSPATIAFAGNFNKVMTISLSLVLFPGELPPGLRGTVVLLSILGNVGAFTAHSILKTRRKKL